MVDFLGLAGIDLLFIVVIMTATFATIYWIVNRRYNSDLQEFFIDTLVNEHDQAIALLSQNSKIILTNKAFDHLLGHSSSKIKGKQFDQLSLKSDLLEALTKSDSRIRRNGSTHVSYNHKITRYKQGFWLNIQKRTINLEKNGNTYVLLLITDISEKKKVEERLFNAQIEYQQLVESANDIIYRTDIAGNIIYSNAAITHILGYDSDFLRKMNIKDIIAEGDVTKLVDFFTHKLNEVNGEDYIEFRAETMSGSVKWLGQKTTLITSGDEVIGLQSVARDITSRIEAEQELLRAKEIAENASEAKSNFISSLSHEFRTPLNAILGYSQILERNRGILPDEKNQVTEIRNAGEKLLSMVDDILELSNLDAKHTKAHEERMLIKPYMDNYAHRFSELSRIKNLEFKYEADEHAPEYLITDFTRLSLVLKNVLDNALKFTSEGSIEFAFSITNADLGHQLNIVVKDTGEGVSEKHLEDAFLPFWQSEPLKNTGTGLGLTLSKRIVEFLGGNISLCQNESGGVTVSISVPVEVVKIKHVHQKLNFSQNGETNSEIEKSGATRILIVDDLLPNRTITRIILHENGIDFKEAEDGLEALTMIESYDPDVILMDINMPVMDGIEAMEKIRSRDWKYKDIPIIAVTAGAMGGRTELLELGFTDYLQKPFRENDLLNAIHLSLEEREAKFLIDQNKNHAGSQLTESVKVADFINTLDSVAFKSIQKIIEQQDLDQLSESKLLQKYPAIAYTEAIQQLIHAAEEYDYLFIANVGKRLKEYSEIRS